MHPSRGCVLGSLLAACIITALLTISGDAASALPTSRVINTFAGGGIGDGGPPLQAALNEPSGVAVDAQHNIFIADSQNCRVRKVSNGQIQTIAGNGLCAYSGDDGPATQASIEVSDVVVSPDGTLYLAGACSIRKISDGRITRVAGNPVVGIYGCGFAGDDGPAIDAVMQHPAGMSLDASGNLFFADTFNCRVRKISRGVITTVVGVGQLGGLCPESGDGGPAKDAGLTRPASTAVTSSGDLFILDNCRIRRVHAGVITSFAGNGTCGSGGDGGLPSDATLGTFDLAVDSSDDILLADRCRIRLATTTLIRTIAGGACPRDSFGSFLIGQIAPIALSVAGGDIYFIDGCLVRLLQGGVITTVAGSGGVIGSNLQFTSQCRFGGDGGPATNAGLNAPSAVALSPDGSLIIADTLDCRIRRVGTDGVISTVAGDGVCGDSADNVPARELHMSHPRGVAVSPSGDIYISDTDNCRIRRVRDGIATIVVGVGYSPCDYNGDGAAPTHRVNFPLGLDVSLTGDLYIADSGNCRIRKVSGGIISTVDIGTTTPGCIFSPDGSVSLRYPTDVKLDAAGDLFVADTGNCRIRKVSAGVMTTIAGEGPCDATIVRPSVGNELQQPSGIAVSVDGSVVYIADTNGCRVVALMQGELSRLTGPSYCGFAGDGGLVGESQVSFPSGLALDGAGNLYVADENNNRVRSVVVGVPATSTPTLTPTSASTDTPSATPTDTATPTATSTKAPPRATATPPVPHACLTIGQKIRLVIGTARRLGARQGERRYKSIFDLDRNGVIDVHDLFIVFNTPLCQRRHGSGVDTKTQG